MQEQGRIELLLVDLQSKGKTICSLFRFYIEYYNKNFYYNILICRRVFNKRTNLGNIYFENIYIINTSNKKLKVTWFTKKKGTNCGILYIYIS